MPQAQLKDITLNYREDGDPNGAPLVFINSLGTDLSLWDQIMPLLPAGLRIIRFDKRGHGDSEVTAPPYGMGTLVRDCEQLLDLLNVRDAMVVGLSIGGMIAQGLAVKRLDQVRALVLSNTAAKIGQPTMWHGRMELARHQGMAPLVEPTMERWFTKSFRNTPTVDHWRQKLLHTPVDGFIGCCAAIAGTDFYTPTSGLRLPTLGIAGSDDGSTPADLVRETTDLIPGSQFKLIRRAGHIPCVEQPEAYAEVLNTFITDTGHI
ncbi:3-oxoadipate enol-lactonase [Phaeobacter sp. CNT1-3]|nr:3-oxoadipate enol-lactonase [Phaeobacter sp. CNT1-3]